MLATSSPTTASVAAITPTPDTADTAHFGTGGAVGAYKAFVLKYLQDNISSIEANTIPNFATASATYAATPFNLDIPTNVSITYNATTPDYRYLHARGIYIDYLDPNTAGKAITNAISTCASSPASNCFLPILPFTTINLTDISNWSVPTTSSNCTLPPQAMLVNNNPVIGTTFNANRGVVNTRQCAASSETSNVQALIGDSNSGIAALATGFANPVDPDDASHTKSDAQQFTKAGGASGGSGTVAATITFGPTPNTATGALPYMYSSFSGSSYPSLTWQLDSVAAPTGGVTACTANSTKSGNNNPLTNYSCPAITTASAAPIAGTITAVAKNYNFAYTTSVSNPCGGGNAAEQHCQNYAVDTSHITVNGVSVTPASVNYSGDGLMSEAATIAFPSLTLGATDTVYIQFQLTSDTATTAVCVGNKATYPVCPP